MSSGNEHELCRNLLMFHVSHENITRKLLSHESCSVHLMSKCNTVGLIAESVNCSPVVLILSVSFTTQTNILEFLVAW